MKAFLTGKYIIGAIRDQHLLTQYQKMVVIAAEIRLLTNSLIL